MSTWYIISVFLHIVCASFWIGGMLFLPLVLLPSIKTHPDRIALLYATGLKFRFVGWIFLLVLLFTGIGNAYFKGVPLEWNFFINTDYGRLLAYKSALFCLMLLISGVHDFYIGKRALEDYMQQNNSRLKLIARWTGRINLIIALAIAFLGVALSRGWF